MRVIAIAVALLLMSITNAIANETREDESCITVEVNGVRTLPYECLSRQLRSQESGISSRQNRHLETLSARTAARPPNELGLANRSATSIRMGSNFGISAQPQRPPAPVMQSPLSPAR